MCKSCATKVANAKKIGKDKSTFGDLGGVFANMTKKEARRRNLEYSVTNEYLWNLFLKQGKKCALTGLDITLSHKLKNKCPNYDLITASLDRIDSSKGYIKDNIQWVHKVINIMKNTLTNEQFIFMCTKVSEFKKDNFEPSLVIGNINLTRKVQRLTGDELPSNNPDTSARQPKIGKFKIIPDEEVKRDRCKAYKYIF